MPGSELPMGEILAFAVAAIAVGVAASDGGDGAQVIGFGGPPVVEW